MNERDLVLDNLRLLKQTAGLMDVNVLYHDAYLQLLRYLCEDVCQCSRNGRMIPSNHDRHCPVNNEYVRKACVTSDEAHKMLEQVLGETYSGTYVS